MLATTTAARGASFVRGDDTNHHKWTACLRRSRSGEGTKVIYTD